jgi:hypothetical protein
MYDRKLILKLCLCVWEVLSEYLKTGVTLLSPIPACIFSVQTFGEFLNFNPHLHIIAADGCFDKNGNFMKGSTPNALELEPVFASVVIELLKEEGKLDFSVIQNMSI